MIASDYQTESRMALKRQAIPLPNFVGKRVLDIGFDFGYWSFLAAEKRANEVVGLDRNRHVKGIGNVDLVGLASEQARKSEFNCSFHKIDIGKQWFGYGQFDIVFLFSLYHHIFQNTGGDHHSIWFWLSRHVKPGGVLLWENPINTKDSVVQMNVSQEYHSCYHLDAILGTAATWFHIQHIGPALHEEYREVYRFTRRLHSINCIEGTTVEGAGGATGAFNYADGRRIKEIENILGFKPYPGSLNVQCDQDFDWNQKYFRAQLLDVTDRGHGLASTWANRWARFYPVGGDVFAFRFEGERYPQNFVELIAERRLRDEIGPRIKLWQ